MQSARYISAQYLHPIYTQYNIYQVYNPRTDRWSFIASMTTRRSRSAVATVGNLLYAMGGFDSTNDLASAECFNPQINKVGN